MMQKFNPASIGKSKHAQGIYQLRNPMKYKGTNAPVYRSSWEKDFCEVCDENPNIISWCVEPFSIQYQCPLDPNKTKNYWPDFIIELRDPTGKTSVELIEIRPSNLTKNPRTKKEKELFIINMSKWAAAKQFCDKNNITFRVLTENELYSNKGNRK